MKSDKKFKRKCVACSQYKDKQDLIKITKTKEGEIILNPDTLTHGRSVYICKNEECINLAIKNKKINKALKSAVSQEILEQITIKN
ncbi:MAG: YlxR family protein [Candidatus Gastranaerophilales bacterium]|nr:YlxR family protein [Candidatus Gastranaerophilales bacterium]